MTDQQDLYFLGLLTKAYDSPNPRKAIADALEQIRILGRQPEYQEGYRNYKAFLHEILANSGLATDLAENILHRIETGDFKEISNEQLNALLELVEDETLASPEAPDATLCELTLQTTDGQRLEIQLHPGEPYDLQWVKPGEYTLTFAGGREIWTGKLQPEHLIWSLAYPSEALPAAAAAWPAEITPTYTTSLLSGEILLETFPGIENGSLRLRWNK